MSKKDLEDYTEISHVSFNNEDPHIAATHKVQGFSANGWHKSLITKANETAPKEIKKALEQVEVKMSFEEFVKKFFHMYHDDAELLAKLLGFKTEYEEYLESSEDEPNWYEKYLDESTSQFKILKSNDLTDVSSEVALEILELQRRFEKGLDLNSIVDADLNSTSSGKDEVIKSKSPQKNEVSLKPEDIVKSKEFKDAIALKVEEISKAKDKEISELTGVVSELKKAKDELSAELETFVKAREQRIRDGFKGMVESFQFLKSAEEKEVLADVLYKAKEVEGFQEIVKSLEAAKAEIEEVKKSFVDSTDTGIESEDTQVISKSTDTFEDSIAAKYAGVEHI